MEDKTQAPPSDKKSPPENRQLITVPIEYLPLCNPEDDEIDLRELLAVLIRQKWLIAVILVLVMALGSFYAFVVAKPLYEARATIEIGYHLPVSGGKASGRVYFGSAAAIKHYLDTRYDTSGKYRAPGTMAWVSKITVPKKAKRFLSVTALGSDNKLAVAALQQPLDDILTRHRLFYDAILEKKKDAARNLEKQVSVNRKIILPQLQTALKILQTTEVQKLESQIRLARTGDLGQLKCEIAFLEEQEIPTIEKKIAECRKEINEKEAAIDRMRVELKNLVQKDAAMATLIALQISNLGKEISRLQLMVLDYRGRIKKIRKETIPGLEKKKTEIIEQVIPDLEARKRHLVEEKIPGKKAEITELLEQTIPDLETQIRQLKRRMAPPYLVKTAIVGGIQTHDHPVKPRKALIVSLSGVLGLMLGLFLAFLREYLTPHSSSNPSQ